MTSEITSTLRIRIGQEEAHYGGNLVEGARMLKLFGDIITEIAVITDGDEGLFVRLLGHRVHRAGVRRGLHRGDRPRREDR